MAAPERPYAYHDRPPTLGEYRALCEDVGWGPFMNFDAAEASLAASLHHVCVTHEDEVVGMGRLVGDGHIYFYVQDVAVLRAHQGRGVGREIVRRLVAYVRETAPDRAFLALFAAPGTEPFYERFGFRVRPGLVGMYQTTSRDEKP